MLETILTGGALAIAGAVTTLSWRDPDAYFRVYKVISALSLLAMMGLGIWDSALSKAKLAILPLLDSAVQKSAWAAIETYEIGIGMGAGIPAAVMVFATALLFMPWLKGSSK